MVYPWILWCLLGSCLGSQKLDPHLNVGENLTFLREWFTLLQDRCQKSSWHVSVFQGTDRLGSHMSRKVPSWGHTFALPLPQREGACVELGTELSLSYAHTDAVLGA